ncbi:MAG: hypothetical protein JNK85_02155, partial [Verrucomicrobiales bacterium]|nr:hypothetical protein [Verrucomicrobiales bacterium]
GGGLWLTLGPRTQPETFAQAFFRGGSGLSPYALGSPVGDPGQRDLFTSIRAASDAHPATLLLSDFQRLDLDRARVFRRHAFDVSTGRDVSILLQAQGGDPVAIERKLGRGRVIVQAIPLGISWSTLPLCQAYVALLHEWLWYLGEPSLPRRNLSVGDAFSQTIPGLIDRATLQTPNGARTSLTPERLPGGNSRLRAALLRHPGDYAITCTPSTGTSTTFPFQVRRDARESDFTGLGDQDLAKIQEQAGFQIGNGLRNVANTASAPPPRHPLEGWFLKILPWVVLGEILLAGWMSQRRNRQWTAVSMGT